MTRKHLLVTLITLCLSILALPLAAQQTGAVHGRVTASDGSALPGVTVEARSNVLPQPRVTVSDGAGEYRLPALQPGNYTLTFTLAGMQPATRKAQVLLGQDINADVKLGVAAVAESITVTAQATLVNKESTAIQSGISSQEIQALPITQDYRDLQKLIPGVMYTQDAVRGPSAGASGQDNVYMFDGANITMPLFGVLNADPNTHDIAQVNIVKGGAKATDFNRAGGFLIDSVSKSGTNQFSGEVGYQILKPSWTAPQAGGARALTYATDKSWMNANLGGPILPDRLFFYGSYYRPYFKKASQANVYGQLPAYEDKRSDIFGKLTFTPTQAWLLNGSYRKIHQTQTASDFSTFQAPTTGTGYDTSQKLGTLETSWIINANSFATAKLYKWDNPGFGRADTLSTVVPSFALGSKLPLTSLGVAGRLVVPKTVPGNDAYNAFIQPFINQYGYICPPDAAAKGLTCTPGQATGGGTVGYGLYSDNNDSFYRKSGQAAYNYTLGANITHDLHVGYQRNNDSEDLYRTSNGWGSIAIPAGVGAPGTCPKGICDPNAAVPAYFTATVSQQQAKGVPVIHSEFHSQNVELNDTIRMSNWTFNVGVMASNDKLYGQGLAKADNVAGFVKSPGTKYLMHDFKFSDMIQPRLGTTWAYNGLDTVWASYARYMPPANSDARAASWDRNLVADINLYFDQTGTLIGIDPVAGSSGKWWQEGIKHPRMDEYLIGTARQLTNRWSARVYGGYKKGSDFMEDTNNNARQFADAPSNIPHDLYVPNLGTTSTPGTILNAIGSGSSYVIANLDGAFTKYYSATAESEWRGDQMVVNGSYTWSHYYGNFDQDNSTFNSNNDQATFIGSSNIGDAVGRQLWNMRYGNLRADRRHVVKLRGTYVLPWQATTGAFFVYQSGQPYQLESYLPYRNLTTSTSETSRYAEPAGTRISPAHYQMDLNYTQNIPLFRGIRFQLVGDVFNVFNKQTGYNYETRIMVLGLTTRTDIATVALPKSITPDILTSLKIDPNSRITAPYAKSFYAPRRFQVSARIQF